MWSETVSNLTANPRCMGTLETATHEGIAGTPGEGPYLILQLEIVDGQIKRAAFQCNGCPAAIACGSMTTLLMTGRTIAQAQRLTPEDILCVLRGLPEGKEYYASMAVEALYQAIEPCSKVADEERVS